METDAAATPDGTPPVVEPDAPQASEASEAAEEASVKQPEGEHPTDPEATPTPDGTLSVADPSGEPDAPEEAASAEEASVKQQEEGYLALFREAIISNYLFSGYSFDELRALATEFSFLELEVRPTPYATSRRRLLHASRGLATTARSVGRPGRANRCHQLRWLPTAELALGSRGARLSPRACVRALQSQEGSSVFEVDTDASFMLIVLRGGLRVAINGNPVVRKP